MKVDLGQARRPAEGNFITEAGKLIFHADYEPPAEVADGELADRFPLALVTPKTHLFLNSTFANQRQARRSHPELVLEEDAQRRGIEDGTTARAFNDRGEFRCVARVSDDARPGVVVAPMGWWNADYSGARASQATTSQRLTDSAPRHLQRQPRRGRVRLSRS